MGQIIKFTNNNGKSIEFSMTKPFILQNVEGLSGIDATEISYKGANQDGSEYQGSNFENRELTIKFSIEGKTPKDLLELRSEINNVFNPKLGEGTLLYSYQGVERILNCVADSTPFLSLKGNKSYCEGEVILIAHNPYFKDIKENKSNIAMWRGMFHFPLIMPSTIIPHSGVDSTWKDLSGNLNNGLLSGFNFDATSGWTTEGLKFDSDSYVTLPTLDLQEGTIQVNNQVITFDKDTDYRTTSANSNIVSLNTTVDGIMDVELGGRTLQNIIKNGNFSNGMTNWSIASSTASVSNNTLSITGSGADNTPRANYDGVKLYSLNHKYYIKASARVITDSCRRLIHRTFGASPTDTTIEYPVQNTWYTMSNVFTVASEPTSVQYFGHSYVDATTAVGKVMELKEVIAIDLTAMFGVGNEPTKEWCDANIQWFEGIRSVAESENLEVVSCGKNLFDNTLTTTSLNGITFTINSDKSITVTGSTSTSSVQSMGAIDVKKIIGKTIVIPKTNVTGLRFYVHLTYSDGTVSYNWLSSIGTNTKVIPSNASVINIGIEVLSGFVSSGTILYPQIEEGTTPTYYEQYKEHRQPISLTNPLKGLPNGVRDIAKENEVNRNVGKVVLDGSITPVLSSSMENTIKFAIGITPSVLYTNLYNLICDKFTTGLNILIYDTEGIRTSSTASAFYISIAKSKLVTPDVAGFKAWLQANPITVYYQLATPTIENLAQALKLKSFSSGTLQFNTLIPPYLSAYYPISLGGSLASNVSRLDISNPLIMDLVKNYRVYDKILTTEEVARANTTNYLRGPTLLVDLNSSHKELSKTGIIMGLREPSLIVNVYNNGDVKCGLKIEFRAKGSVKNPSLFNVNTREYIKINKTMAAGEIINVNTSYGHKKIESELNGVKTNIMNYLALPFYFLQLDPGDNLFRYDAEENLNNLEVNIFFTPQYLGV